MIGLCSKMGFPDWLLHSMISQSDCEITNNYGKKLYWLVKFPTFLTQVSKSNPEYWREQAYKLIWFFLYFLFIIVTSTLIILHITETSRDNC